MSATGLLLAATILLPLAMAAGCLSQRFRARAPALLVLAPLPAMLAALLLPDGASASVAGGA